MFAIFLNCLLLLVGVLLAADCFADRVRIPLDMQPRFIESLIREQVFTGANDSVRINDDGSGCQFLELRQPRVSQGAGQVRLLTAARARAGRPLGGGCILLLDWRGQLEFSQRPVVSDDRQSVVLRTESWRALTPDGQTATLSTTIGHWLERYLPLNLKETRISLVQPLTELREFLALVISEDNAAQVSALLDSVAVDDVSARDDRVTVTLGLDTQPAAAPPQVAEPSLSQTELAQLETRLEAVDAFVTYLIRHLTTGRGAAGNVETLFDVLLELRLDLIAVVGEPQRHGQDPARALFVNAWERLTPVLHEMAEQQADYDSAARYLTFIGAGDMLRALDALGPSVGIAVSSDGLRRLARILIPDEAGDPLQRSDAVDPELRRSLGFGEPLPPPESTAETAWLDWLVKPALAAGGLNAGMVKKLNNWVPKIKEMDVYLPMVRDVLNHVVKEQLRAKELDPAFHQVFRQLVLTAAWQESCWRQFVAEKNKRVPLQSGTGDIGMMQINPKIWRGFYDLHGLKWDIVYNTRAGADILQHHMINYAIGNREHKTTGKLDNLARSAYAAYNGGPRQYNRYRRGDANAHGKKADTLFYEKFRVIKSGQELKVKSCFR